MTTAPIVFMDTETTGLSLDDDIWEFAAVRRRPDGHEASLHLFLEHDVAKCSRLPESFREDHRLRFPAGTTEAWSDHVVSRAQAAELITAFLGDDRPHIVGAVPSFDTERVARLLQLADDAPRPWHYHLADVENLAIGWLRGGACARGLVLDGLPPWDSEQMSHALGVTAPPAERHTAMGDVRWAMRMWDVVMGTGAGQ